MTLKKSQNIAELRQRLRVLEGTAPSLEMGAKPSPATHLKLAAIDDVLPWKGLPPGLHEVTGPQHDTAAHGFAAAVLGRVMETPGHLLWCRVKRAAFDNGFPYGPGLVHFGLSASRIVFVEAESRSDALWAMEEGLHSRGLSAVYGEGIALDLTAGRRLQLAAETGKKTAIALTIAHKSSSVTAATTRWNVTTLPSAMGNDAPRSRWCLALTRCRGGNAHSWIVEWDHETHGFDLAAPLADRLLATAAN